jgi:2-C-methyl-D-erythritol 2,4-cyclodiphosphate synthase
VPALSCFWLSAIIRADSPITQNHGWGQIITSKLRIGFGEDSHRTEPGGPLRIGGVNVPHDRQLVGHSDGDVLLHAVTDALLGAAALPDIGRTFPNTDPAHHNRDSAEMLAIAAFKVTNAGYQIVNLDCVVHAERPKLSDYMDAIRHRIAGILHLNPHDVGLKAKTGEGVGPVGNGEVIEARCVALVENTSVSIGEITGESSGEA